MHTKLTVIAHTFKSAHSYENWKVLVEIDRDTVGKLLQKYGPECPNVGNEIDLAGILARVEKLEEREKQVEAFRSLLEKIGESKGGAA